MESLFKNKARHLCCITFTLHITHAPHQLSYRQREAHEALEQGHSVASQGADGRHVRRALGVAPQSVENRQQRAARFDHLGAQKKKRA